MPSAPPGITMPMRDRWGRAVLALGAVLVLGACGAAAAATTGGKCFGAGARDPAHHCGAPKPVYAVSPAPSRAASERGSACTRERKQGLAEPCAVRGGGQRAGAHGAPH